MRGSKEKQTKGPLGDLFGVITVGGAMKSLRREGVKVLDSG
jgi:hypothetical protein